MESKGGAGGGCKITITIESIMYEYAIGIWKSNVACPTMDLIHPIKHIGLNLAYKNKLQSPRRKGLLIFS